MSTSEGPMSTAVAGLDTSTGEPLIPSTAPGIDTTTVDPNQADIDLIIIICSVSGVVLIIGIIIIVCCACRHRSQTIQRMRRNTNSRLERIKSLFRHEARNTDSSVSNTSSQAQLGQGSAMDMENQGFNANVVNELQDDDDVSISAGRNPPNLALPEVPKSGSSPRARREGQKNKQDSPAGLSGSHDDMPTEPAPPPPHAVPGYIPMGSKNKRNRRDTIDSIESAPTLDVSDRTVPLPPGMDAIDMGTMPAPSPHSATKARYVNSSVNVDKKYEDDPQEFYENTWQNRSLPNLADTNLSMAPPPPKPHSPAPSSRSNSQSSSFNSKTPSGQKAGLGHKGSNASTSKKFQVPVPASPEYGNVGQKPDYKNISQMTKGKQLQLKESVPLPQQEPEELYENNPDFGQFKSGPGYMNINQQNKPGYVNLQDMDNNQNHQSKWKSRHQ